MNNHLFKTKDNLTLPLSFRWFVAQGLVHFQPWFIFDDLTKGAIARKAFKAENVQGRDVVPITHRQDCDDFAGFEIRDNVILENIIYFHPAFNYKLNTGIVTSEHDTFWLFIREVIVPDMEDWASEEDLEDIITDGPGY